MSKKISQMKVIAAIKKLGISYVRSSSYGSRGAKVYKYYHGDEFEITYRGNKKDQKEKLLEIADKLSPAGVLCEPGVCFAFGIETTPKLFLSAIPGDMPRVGGISVSREQFIEYMDVKIAEELENTRKEAARREARDKAAEERENAKLNRVKELNPKFRYTLLEGDEEYGIGIATLVGDGTYPEDGLVNHHIQFAWKKVHDSYGDTDENGKFVIKERKVFDVKIYHLNLQYKNGKPYYAEGGSTGGRGETIQDVLFSYLATWHINV